MGEERGEERSEAEEAAACDDESADGSGAEEWAEAAAALWLLPLPLALVDGRRLSPMTRANSVCGFMLSRLMAAEGKEGMDGC